jgi:hypothetical protein
MDHQRTGTTVGASLLIGGLTLLSAPAEAQELRDGEAESPRSNFFKGMHFAGDFDLGEVIDDPLTDGIGGALRYGREFELAFLSLRSEAGGSYRSFSDATDASDETLRIYSGFFGGRLAVGKIVEPSIFSHVGVAWLRGIERRTAPVFDAGAALDFTLIPLVEVGVHGTYNMIPAINDDSAKSWLLLGAHAALVL